MTEYVGCKIDWNREERFIKFTQPVLIQSFTDEFELPNRKYNLPGEPGKVLTQCDDEHQIGQSEQKRYRMAVGKLLHLMRWSRPDIWNSVREASRRMNQASNDHVKAISRIMKYCVDTKNRGWMLQPNRKWDGIDLNFEFRINGRADSNFATCRDTRKSITGYVVWFEGAVIAIRSVMQKIVALSVTEAEVIAIVQCVQEIMYVKKVLEGMNLKVETPILIETDNKGAYDLINGWSTTGGTKHMDVRIMFLRELKEKKIIRMKWIPSEENTYVLRMQTIQHSRDI